MEITTNYHLLLIRCLKEEIKAYLTYSDTEKEVEFREMATDWLFDDDYNPNGEFSCKRICNVLGHKIETLRRNVMFAKKKEWTLDEYMNYSLYGEEPKGRKANGENE